MFHPRRARSTLPRTPLASLASLARAGRGNSLALLPLILLSAAVMIAAQLRGPFGSPGFISASVLLVGTVLFEGVVSRFTVSQERWTVSVTEGLLVVILAFEPGSWVGLAGGAGMLTAQFIRRRRDPIKITFNVVQYGASFATGGTLAAMFSDPRVGAAVGAAAFWAVNLSFVAFAMTTMTEDTLTSVLRKTLPMSVFHIAVNLTTGLAAAVIIRTDPAASIWLAVPVLAVLASYAVITRRVEETSLMDIMLAKHAESNPLSLEATAQVILRTAAKVYSTPDVRLVLLCGSDGPVDMTLEQNSGNLQITTGAVPSLDESWMLRSIAEQRGVLTGASGSRAWCALRIGPVGKPLAALLVARGGTAPGFDRADLRVGAVIAKRAERWIELNDQHPNQMRCEQQQAASAVQSAAFALAHTALRVDDEGDLALLRALHDVQRAVTGLLGTSGDAPGSPDTAAVRPAAQSTDRSTARGSSHVGTGPVPAALPVPDVAGSAGSTIDVAAMLSNAVLGADPAEPSLLRSVASRDYSRRVSTPASNSAGPGPVRGARPEGGHPDAPTRMVSAPVTASWGRGLRSQSWVTLPVSAECLGADPVELGAPAVPSTAG